MLNRIFWGIGMLVLSSTLFSYNLQAQDDEYVIPEPRNYDYIYRNNIKSVQFYLGDQEVALPMIELRSTGPLVLEFDDMSGDPVDYSYKIIHVKNMHCKTPNFCGGSELPKFSGYLLSGSIFVT
ncbi:MAG: DUF5103 domain-containing protein [Saprospiraceae bacterium]|nr:DUF5103 domain-containing protein [Saprospiraceae bacterium]